MIQFYIKCDVENKNFNLSRWINAFTKLEQSLPEIIDKYDSFTFKYKNGFCKIYHRCTYLNKYIKLCEFDIELMKDFAIDNIYDFVYFSIKDLYPEYFI